MAEKDGGLVKPHPVLSAGFSRWLNRVQALKSRAERLSKYTVRLGAIDSAILRLKLQRAVVKREALVEAKSLGITRFLAYTHRTALVLQIPLTFASRNSNSATARAVRTLLIERLGKSAVKGKVKRVRKITISNNYQVDPDLRDAIHALNDPLLELELAKLLGCTIEASAGKPSKALLTELLEREQAQE